MDISILYEDGYLLAIDKPSGVVVNRSENVSSQTIQDWAEDKLNIKNQDTRNNKSNFYDRAGIVHRLDKETSGILLIAKDKITFLNLQDQFKNRTVKKSYSVLVHGNITIRKMTIKVPVGRLPWNKRKFGVLPYGRNAETRILVRHHYEDDKANRYSLIEAIPVTGRTHQIRIHLKHFGFPVVADYLYSGRKVYREAIKFCPRLFLHAYRLQFNHPETSESKSIEKELPLELNQVLEKLKLVD